MPYCKRGMRPLVLALLATAAAVDWVAPAHAQIGGRPGFGPPVMQPKIPQIPRPNFPQIVQPNVPQIPQPNVPRMPQPDIRMPQFQGIQFQTFWKCSRCGANMGQGPHPPVQCPNCRAFMSNNPENQRGAAATGIGIALVAVVLVIFFGILLFATVVVAKRMSRENRKRRTRDLPIARTKRRTGSSRSRGDDMSDVESAPRI